ncbi:aldehyde dehydrogenase family protein [Natribaculum luteum]|uniref:Aldehyde dehydrogenase family protein n=1 Tax=Natribaculum luteum TaxID=1586232 RepID=A0ABD5NW05_9EURY|nr:aldehyde dehydrogenase family protein [Natribaculum luteum]
MSSQTFTESVEENHTKAIERAAADTTFGHWIDGRTVAPSSGRQFETIDPAVAQPISDVARGDAEDVDRAVSAARSAFREHWRQMTPADRAGIIREWMDRIREYADELALLESLDTGKPLAYARDEVLDAIEYFEYYVSVARAHEGSHLPQGEDNHVYIRNEPYGVAGQILPWNYPIDLFAWKAGAALAAGNTVVCKPSEEAPLSITRAAQLSEDILPDGVLNVVNGYGTEAGTPLTDHEDVDKLSFTGSVPVGKQVMETAADHVTPVTLELGGKSPFVVFPDADIEQAAETSAAGIFYNTGQSCDACSRILVHEDVHEEFVDAFTEAAADWEPGDPLVDGTTMGPLTFRNQYDKVSKYVGVGRDEGAEQVYGEGVPDREDGEGFFVGPIVFDQVDNQMRIAQEEIFGPVQCLITFENYDEAIELANDVEYGLAAGVATRDASLAHRAAADIQAGSVWINEYHGGGPGIPFGGYKASGIGRECAKETLAEYTHTKAVNLSLDEPSF